ERHSLSLTRCWSWYSNPYITNEVPLWVWFAPSICHPFLEVGDFLTDNGLGGVGGVFPIYMNGVPYGLFEGVFFDWFTQLPSRSVNGWYSQFNTATVPNEQCASDNDKFTSATLDVPGAIRT